MRILVVGAGAVGGYFGAMWARAGRDVTLLLRGERADRVRHEGLVVRASDGEFVARPKVLTAAELRAGDDVFDVVVLAVKAYGLEAAVEDFSPGMGEGSVVLPFLNGMRHIDWLAGRFGRERVLGGWSKISSDLDPDGAVRVFPGYSNSVFNFGELNGGVSERVRRLSEEFGGAGFPVEVSEDILAGMWSKWYLLASLAATTCLLRGSVGEIEGVRYGAETALAVNAECEAIVAAHGYPQSAELKAEHDARMSRPGLPLTASMFRSVKKGEPVEVEHTLGDLLQRAEEKGVSAPLVKAAYVQLSVYERARG